MELVAEAREQGWQAQTRRVRRAQTRPVECMCVCVCVCVCIQVDEKVSQWLWQNYLNTLSGRIFCSETRAEIQCPDLHHHDYSNGILDRDSWSNITNTI